MVEEERLALEAFLTEFRRQLDSLPLSIEQLEDAREDLRPPRLSYAAKGLDARS
jgi:hypothetical protein